MESSNYWTSIARGRASRRALLRGVGAAGLGAATLSLIGCGGSSSSNSTNSSGLVSAPVDSSARAVRGGVLPRALSADPPSLSIYPLTATGSTGPGGLVYSKFFTSTLYNRTKGEKALTTVEPDVVESFEQSPDGLQVTMKLRPNARYDPRPPTNGRNVTIDDVNYSWNALKALHRGGPLLSNEINKSAPIQSVTTPDNRTIVFKLAFRSPGLLPNLAFNLVAPMVLPIEAEQKLYDQRNEARGSGPWMIDKWEPSVGLKYSRNPNWYRKDRPFLDGMNDTIVSEYAQQLAQFKAGRFYTVSVKPADILSTKRDVPDIALFATDDFATTPGKGSLSLNLRPGSPFRDERVRQALSYSMDRQTLTEVFYDVENFRKEGLDVQTYWFTSVGVGESEFWLDPQGSEFGANAKYFKYDLTEATRLIRAAIGKDKLEQPFLYPINRAPVPPEVEIILAILDPSPFKFTRQAMDYDTEWTPKVIVPDRVTGGHDYEGVSICQNASFPEVDSWFTNQMLPGGTFFRFEPDFPSPNDRHYQLIKASQNELDHKKRVEIVKDWQRYSAQTQYLLNAGGVATSFGLAWPWAGNYRAFVTRGSDIEINYWLDKSKMKA